MRALVLLIAPMTAAALIAGCQPSSDSQAEQQARASSTPKATASQKASSAHQTGSIGTDTRDWDGIDACGDGILPEELDEVTEDVAAGGPFEHPEADGSTFQNREELLPDEELGYYREYTVETPGLSHRGQRRVVAGGTPVVPEIWYFTDDHYQSFCEFAPQGD